MSKLALRCRCLTAISNLTCPQSLPNETSSGTPEFSPPQEREPSFQPTFKGQVNSGQKPGSHFGIPPPFPSLPISNASARLIYCYSCELVSLLPTRSPNVFLKHKRIHIIPLIKTLYWPPIVLRIKSNLLTTDYKAYINGPLWPIPYHAPPCPPSSSHTGPFLWKPSFFSLSLTGSLLDFPHPLLRGILSSHLGLKLLWETYLHWLLPHPPVFYYIHHAL